MSAMDARRARLNNANELLGVIACCGRGFFSTSDGGAEKFWMTSDGRLFFLSDHGAPADMGETRMLHRALPHGSTLRGLLENLRDYIHRGELLTSLGTFYWGYPLDAAQVCTERARLLGILHADAPPVTKVHDYDAARETPQ